MDIQFPLLSFLDISDDDGLYFDENSATHITLSKDVGILEDSYWGLSAATADYLQFY